MQGSAVLARYFLPFDELAFLLACVTALSLAQRPGASRLVGVCLVGAILVCEGSGTGQVVRQAMATPMSTRLAEVIEAIAAHSGTRS